MKILKYLIITFFIGVSFTGCYLTEGNGSAKNDYEDNTETQFASDLKTVLAQTEDDEPLEIVDTIDETTSFNTLL